MSLRFGVMGLALGLAACNPSTADAPGTGMQNASGNTPYPCDVGAIIQNNCFECHGAQPQFGAPMSLTTWNDTQLVLPDSRQVNRQPGAEPVWQRIHERIHDSQNLMPQPPNVLAPADIQTLDNWIAAGAPAGTGCGMPNPGNGGGSGSGNGGGENGGGTTGTGGYVSYGGSGAVNSGGNPGIANDADGGALPPSSDCVDIQFHARADGTNNPFPVPAGTSELYQCFNFNIDLQGVTQALSFHPLIGNTQVIHHWLLYQMSGAETDKTSSACIGAHPDGALIAGWAPGAGDWIMPPGVGMELNNNSFILEVHYNNYSGVDQTDNSGVELCGARQPRPNIASISWLGNDLFSIPASTADAPVAGSCVPNLTAPVHIITSWPHMHKRGIRMTADIHRAGGAVESLFDKPFSFNTQWQYPTPTIINPGDSILTTCHFDNTDPFTVSFGEKTTDEMCFNFTVAYPAHTLIEAGINSLIHKDECIQAAVP